MATATLTTREVWRRVAQMTAVAVVISMVMTAASLLALLGPTLEQPIAARNAFINGMAIAVVVPLLVCPLITWRIVTTTRELERARGELDRIARTDPLTGLFNRRGFREAAAAALAATGASSRPVAVLMLDVDRFKSINDRFGHDTGDRALAHIAHTLTQALPQVLPQAPAIAARQGGEEFAVLLPEATLAEARATAEALRTACAAAPLPIADGPLPVTVSIGLAVECRDLADLDTLLQRADAALYRAKAGGRNCVELAETRAA